MKGEFELIDKIRERFQAPEGIVGIGDDCAVIPRGDGLETLVSCDLLMEDIHFRLNRIPPFDLGWKSAAVNISDIAAMGGKPTSVFLGLSIPEGFEGRLRSDGNGWKCDPESWFDSFFDGYKTLCDRFETSLLGGDTTGSRDRLGISVTVLGECPEGQEIRRDGAREGDLICVTGTLGDSAAGFRLLSTDTLDDLENRLIQRHFHPVPRISEGISLRGFASSMMDISDGVASDLRHILKASGVGATVQVSKLPLSEDLLACSARHGWDPVEIALEGGEDYELLFTVSPEKEKRLRVPHTVIGRINAEKQLVWEGSDRDYLGFRHSI